MKLGLDLRDLGTAVPALHRDAVSRAVKTLMCVHADLRELSRGMHPAILSKGGLGHAIKALARRSAVPTSSTIDIGRRLAESFKVAAYYVVAEALTNTTKHARASTVHACPPRIRSALVSKRCPDLRRSRKAEWAST